MEFIEITCKLEAKAILKPMLLTSYEVRAPGKHNMGV